MVVEEVPIAGVLADRDNSHKESGCGSQVGVLESKQVRRNHHILYWQKEEQMSYLSCLLFQHQQLVDRALGIGLTYMVSVQVNSSRP